MENKPIESISGLIVAVVSSIEICIDIKDLIVIINPHQTASEELSILESAIVYNNEKIPKINLFNNLKSIPYSDNPDVRIIVLQINNQKFCLFVDLIKEVITLNSKNQKHLKFLPDENTAPYFVGKISYLDRNFFYMNFNKILDDVAKIN